MKRIGAWLKTERARLEAAPRLSDALLGIHPHRYAAYRLRYTLVRSLLRTGLRIFELALFASILPFEMVGTVLVVRSCMFVTESLWWGALEPLRDEVGNLLTRGRTGQASLRIRQWLVLAVVLGVAAVLGALLFVGFGPSRYRTLSVVDLYLCGSAVRWALDLCSTTYHAGVYGARRVYRPLWSLFLTDVAEVVLLGGAYWWLGGWGIGVSLVLVGGVRAVTSWAFTRRVYRQLRLSLGGPRAWLVAWSKGVWSPRRSWQFALGNVVGEVDSLLVVGLVATPGNPRSTLLLAALFHVLTPLQAAASSWPRPFYFDFKRLQAWGSPLLLQRFESFLDRVMWWVPVPIGLVTLLLLVAFWRGDPGWLAFELLCFAAIRARLSLIHVHAYALGDHRFLRRLLLVMLGAAAVAPVAAFVEAQVALGLVTAVAALGLVFVGRPSFTFGGERPRGVLGASVWVHYLLREAGPVSLGLARIDRRLTTLGRVERAWREALGTAVLARLSHDTIVWFGASAPALEALSATSGGALRMLELGATHDTGALAFKTGLRSPVWQRHFGEAVARLGSATASSDTDCLTELKRSASAIHPGLVLHPLATATLLPQLAPGSRGELRRTILDAARGRAGFRTIGEFDVAVFAPCGNPVALLAAPTSTRPGRTTWRAEIASLIEHAELADAVDRHAGRARIQT